jgi:hypothetical protein
MDITPLDSRIHSGKLRVHRYIRIRMNVTPWTPEFIRASRGASLHQDSNGCRLPYPYAP